MPAKKAAPAAADTAPDAPAAAPADLSPVREFLGLVEFAGKHNGTPACLDCSSFAPMDPANPREWERHADGCRFAAALAALG